MSDFTWSVIYYNGKEIVIESSTYSSVVAENRQKILKEEGFDCEIANGSDGGYVVANMGKKYGVNTDYDFLLINNDGNNLIRNNG